MGPPYLQKLVADYYAPPPGSEPQSASSSRAASPSETGNGRRLGGSSHNGSSSASAAAGADRLRGGGSGSAGPGAGSLALSGVGRAAAAAEYDDEDIPPFADADDDEPPPAYSFTNDEGYADHDDMAGTYGPIYSGAWNANTEAPSWSFGDLGADNGTTTTEDDGFEDAASDVAAGGSADGDAGEDRLMMDFGDELYGRGGQMHAGQTSRADTPMSEEELPELVGEDGSVIVGMQRVDEAVEERVAEVRVDDDDGKGDTKME